MPGKEHYLKPMLDSGSSRVFNCNDRARQLQKDKSEHPYFFKVPRMHPIVVLKETIVEDRSDRMDDQAIVATKLFIPYNAENVYEGGRSVYFNDPKLRDVLNEQFGLAAPSIAREDLEHDLKMLRILSTLPSLDGFLMRDALEIEGIKTNEHYFEVSEKERVAIHEFIRTKFEPLVGAAFGNQSSLAHKVDFLVDKIWEAKDKSALDPLIQAFRFPDADALNIFAAWKGIIFYSFEYGRSKQKREAFGLWLRDKAMPRNALSKDQLDHTNSLRKATVQKLRHHWSAVEAISREYETLYGKFVSDPAGVVKFIDFLHRSREIYWRMGDSLSKISHAIHCWDVITSAFPERRLASDRLDHVLNMLQLILTEEQKMAEAQVA